MLFPGPKPALSKQRFSGLMISTLPALCRPHLKIEATDNPNPFSPSKCSNAKQPRASIAWGTGGAAYWPYIDVLKVLDEPRFWSQFISDTSMIVIIGAFKRQATATARWRGINS